MRKFIKINILLLLTTWLVSSCNDYFDINNNPNRVTDPDPALTLTVSEIDIANFMQGPYNTTSGFWVQYYTQAGNVAGFDNRDQYVVLPGDNAFARDFTGLYSGPLQDLTITIENATSEGDMNTVAVAMILKAYVFQNLIDLFDKTPYYQANNLVEFPSPEYDEGVEIYDDLIIKLDEAIALLDPLAGNVNGDIILNGDPKKWIKFANTLKLKIFMRQTEVRPTVAQNGIESLDGEEFLFEDAEILYDQEVPANRHPDGVNDINVQSFTAASATSVDTLLGSNDPRIDLMWRSPIEPTVEAGDPPNPQIGVPQGKGSTLGGSTAGLGYYSARGDFIIGSKAAHPFFSAAEVNFLVSEGIVRGWLSGDAEEYYNAGVEASFVRLGVKEYAPKLQDYLTDDSPFPTSGTDEEKIEAIMYQKWVALTGRQSIEMFAEWRRTGYPGTNLIAVSPISLLPPGMFPKRFPFTQREVDLNDNTPDLEDLEVPVWWDND